MIFCLLSVYSVLLSFQIWGNRIYTVALKVQSATVLNKRQEQIIGKNTVAVKTNISGNTIVFTVRKHIKK